MAPKAMNFKMEESEIIDMKQVAGIYNMTVTDLIKRAIRLYVSELKSDPFYRLTVNVEDASPEESAQILNKIDCLSDDDLTISSSKVLDL